MKKKSLKSLTLNKKLISRIQEVNRLKGGGTDNSLCNQTDNTLCGPTTSYGSIFVCKPSAACPSIDGNCPGSYFCNTGPGQSMCEGCDTGINCHPDPTTILPF